MGSTAGGSILALEDSARASGGGNAEQRAARRHREHDQRAMIASVVIAVRTASLIATA